MLVCLCGRSGSGKTTQSSLLKEHKGFKEIVSYTTRKRRHGEENGVDYNFVSMSEFKELIKSNKMLEYTMYDGNYYGTPSHDYKSENWVAVVDMDGVKNLKKILGDEVLAIALEVRRTTSYNRCNARDCYRNIDKLSDRIKKDDILFDDLSIVNHIVNAEKDIDTVYREIEAIIDKHGLSSI